MKKGFTLIELLSVIAILSTILLIAFPIIKNVVDSSKWKAFENSEQVLKKQAYNYLANNVELMPQELGDQTIVYLENLLEEKLITPIYSPFDKTLCDVTASKVTVTKIFDKKYIFTPYLLCGTTESQVDITPPIITLVGDAAISLEIYHSYVEMGVNITDNVDEDVSLIIDDSKLNTNQLGSYTILYIAYDYSGNFASITRTVSVVDDVTEPNNPEIVVNTEAWTNDVVEITINYSDDSVVKEYKIGALGEWLTYSGPFDLSENATVYARGEDLSGNLSEEVTKVISNIDKTLPVVVFGTNGDSDIEIAATTVTVSDFDSGISTLSYVWSLSTETPSSGWNNFTNGENLTFSTPGLYFLHIKALDIAGNTKDIRSNVFDIISLDPNYLFPDYFVGSNPNNYATFAGKTWRILRKNELIHDGVWTNSRYDYAHWRFPEFDAEMEASIGDLSNYLYEQTACTPNCANYYSDFPPLSLTAVGNTGGWGNTWLEAYDMAWTPYTLSGERAYIFDVYYEKLIADDMNDWSDYVPFVKVKNVSVVSGTGTSSNPYVITTN